MTVVLMLNIHTKDDEVNYEYCTHLLIEKDDEFLLLLMVVVVEEVMDDDSHDFEQF